MERNHEKVEDATGATGRSIVWVESMTLAIGRVTSQKTGRFSVKTENNILWTKCVKNFIPRSMNLTLDQSWGLSQKRCLRNQSLGQNVQKTKSVLGLTTGCSETN